MALEPGPNRLDTASPTSSGGRSSPAFRQWRGEEEEYSKDKAFRKYAAGLDRALSLFDTQLQEWADYISFLGRLLKALQARPSNLHIIPSKELVAKRLSQCLNPTLPSGVHSKALDVYNYIFITIGPGGLSNDLLLYLPGLSSTLSFASLTVRSPFLVLFETHILPLDSATLRPAFKAIILALLPGLEDETSEDFEQTYKLVDGLRDAVRPEGAKDEYFWQCFFLASITGSNRRLGALAYLNRELPKLGYRKENFPSSINDVPEEAALESAKVLTSPEGGLLIRCFAAGLKDDQLLIQRGFLELLVTHLPLHSKVFHNFVMVKERDLDLLMAAAIGVVSRRDMSLNRRLWSWLLGPDPAVIESDKGASLAAAATRTRYFEEYGLQSLLRALTEMIKQYPIKPAERYKPYRIALSLMDRWEIGGLVVPQIFMPIIISVKTYQTEAVSKADFNEVLKSASFFFDGVESGIIWGAINTLIGEAMIWPTPKLQDALAKLEVVRFILAHFNVKEEEMVLVHAPCNALSLLALGEKATLTSPFPKPIIQKALLLVSDLIDIIPERAYVSRPPTARSSTEEGKTAYHPTIDNNVLVEKIKLFYSQEGGNLDAVLPPFKNTEVSRLLMRQVSRLTEHAIGTSSLPEPKVGITRIADILRALTSSMPVVATVNVEAIFIAIKAKLLAGRVNFTEFSAIAVILTALFPRYISSVAFTDLVPDIVEAAWSFLSPSSPKYHVETVQALWDLQSALGVESRDIESCLCSLITQNDTEGTFTTRDAESGRRFAVLWNHTLHDHGSSKDRKGSAVGLNSSDTTDIADYKIMLRRPLFLCLDALADERTQMFAWARAWLQGLPTLDSVFHCFVAEFNQFPLFHKEEREGFSSQAVEGGEDIDACVYYLQGLLGLLRWAGIDTWACIAKSRIQLDHDTVKLEMPNYEDDMVLQDYFVRICINTINKSHHHALSAKHDALSQLHRVALALLQQILRTPFKLNIDPDELPTFLVAVLQRSLDIPDPYIQAPLLETILVTLRLKQKEDSERPSSPDERKSTSPEAKRGSLIVNTEHANEKQSISASRPKALPLIQVWLIDCLKAAITSPNTRPVLDNWINFLVELVPLFSDAGTIFQFLIPLVETFCKEIERTFDELSSTFEKNGKSQEERIIVVPETTLVSLMNGLELVLIRAHERLMAEESRGPAIKSPEHTPSFFGNMLAFGGETQHPRTQTANSRLTVLLSFQDAIRICFKIWSWGGRGRDDFVRDDGCGLSFNYTSLKMRNRARKLLEHVFVREMLECLETVVTVWKKAHTEPEGMFKNPKAVFQLLAVLEGGRPKYVISAIFDAIYSRTNPSALEPSRKSSLTSPLTESELVVFLIDYTKNLEDDAMDDIWADCMTFLKDILANPFPHRLILPGLVRFVGEVGIKLDDTGLGDDKKVRREAGDGWVRALTAVFTTNPVGYQGSLANPKRDSVDEKEGAQEKEKEDKVLLLRRQAEDIVPILAELAPSLPKILVEPSLLLAAVTTISASVIAPTIRAKTFPNNITSQFLSLLYSITRLPTQSGSGAGIQKVWKKDISDAFNDARFFAMPRSLWFLSATSPTNNDTDESWAPILRQWALTDKAILPELLARITPPSTAGIVFGVGAASARMDADRRTESNLLRITALLMAGNTDAWVSELKGIYEKIVELLGATPTSSPSSATRGAVYLLLRALVIKISPIHLAFLWPVLNAELTAALSSVVADPRGPGMETETYNGAALVQACKLLDTLLVLAPDDWQVAEWVFIADTIDAVYRPHGVPSVALVDGLSEELSHISHNERGKFFYEGTVTSSDKCLRRGLIGRGRIEVPEGVEGMAREEVIGRVVRPWVGGLSIWAFECGYEMGGVDEVELRRGVVGDVFREGG